jgi:hypothetical protein
MESITAFWSLMVSSSQPLADANYLFGFFMRGLCEKTTLLPKGIIYFLN